MQYRLMHRKSVQQAYGCDVNNTVGWDAETIDRQDTSI